MAQTNLIRQDALFMSPYRQQPHDHQIYPQSYKKHKRKSNHNTNNTLKNAYNCKKTKHSSPQ